MTGNEQALLAQMQDRGYSHGLCVTAIQILSQSRQAVSDMLAYIYDEPTHEARAKSSSLELCLARRRKTKGQQPSEEEFIGEIARICELNGLNPEL